MTIAQWVAWLPADVFFLLALLLAFVVAVAIVLLVRPSPDERELETEYDGYWPQESNARGQRL